MRSAILASLLGAALGGMAFSSALADTRPLDGFTGVGAQGHFDVVVAMGDHYAVDVTGPDAARITTRIEGHSLKIEADQLQGFARYNAVVHVTTPRLEAVAVAAGSNMSAAPLNADHFSAAASSGGQVRLTGQCHDLQAAVSSGGDIIADALNCQDGNIAASSGGEARVQVHQTLNAVASSGSSIKVHGNPANRAAHVSSGAGISYE